MDDQRHKTRTHVIVLTVVGWLCLLLQWASLHNGGNGAEGHILTSLRRGNYGYALGSLLGVTLLPIIALFLGLLIRKRQSGVLLMVAAGIGIIVSLWVTESSNLDAKLAGSNVAENSNQLELFKAVLECRANSSSEHVIASYSLSKGGTVPFDSGAGELHLYFDEDDCSGGAIMGHDDTKGWIFPIGAYDWPELIKFENLPIEAASTEGITPISKESEGYAFWLRSLDGRYAMVRITDVTPLTFSEVALGRTARIQFEWIWR